MPPALIPDDEEYASEEDSDFAPDLVPVRDEEESDEEVDGEVTTKAVRRKRGHDEEAEDAGFENSGDEAVLVKALKRQKRKGKNGKVDGEELDDEGGEGGFIKTRRQRAAEKEEKKYAVVDTSKVTIDVDAMWANMISGKPTTTPNPDTEIPTATSSKSPETKGINDVEEMGHAKSPEDDGPDSMIKIKRTYNFAGKVHTEERLVKRSSAEAKLYLSSLPSQLENDPSSPFTKPKRPPKKAHHSIFEPPSDLPPRKDLHFGVRASAGERLNVGEGKEKKLNTVEKSAMDWAGFVDKEGIAEELDQAGKAKGAYRAREEFLARVEMKRVEEERRARGVVV